MKTITKLFLLALLFIVCAQNRVLAQGCVAIHSTGGICEMSEHPDSEATAAGGYWLYNDNDRYYRSYKHFVGKEEQYQRFAMHNNVINHVFTQDNAFTRVFNDRWSVTVDIPYMTASRSQVNS